MKQGHWNCGEIGYLRRNQIRGINSDSSGSRASTATQQERTTFIWPHPIPASLLMDESLRDSATYQRLPLSARLKADSLSLASPIADEWNGPGSYAALLATWLSHSTISRLSGTSADMIAAYS